MSTVTSNPSFYPTPIYFPPTQITTGWIDPDPYAKIIEEIRRLHMQSKLETAWKIAMKLQEKNMVKADTVPEFVAIINAIMDALEEKK